MRPEWTAVEYGRTALPRAQWDVLLAVAAAFDVRLPGPTRKHNVDQVLVLWQRVLRSSGGPVEEYRSTGVWFCWPPRTDLPLQASTRATPGSTHLARTRVSHMDLGVAGDEVPAFRAVTRLEAWLVLLHSVVSEECSRPEPRLVMPELLVAEATRLLVAGRVETSHG